MKPYKHILDSKKVLKSLISEAKTMDNVKTRLTELNTLITLVNSFEEMLSNKYFTEIFDLLILNSMHYYFVENKTYESNEIDIKGFTYLLRRDMRYGRQSWKQSIIGMMQGCQVNNSLKRGEVEMDSYEDWSTTLETYLSEIKQGVEWDKKYKKCN